jgi:hypothetical protein
VSTQRIPRSRRVGAFNQILERTLADDREDHVLDRPIRAADGGLRQAEQQRLLARHALELSDQLLAGVTLDPRPKPRSVRVLCA